MDLDYTRALTPDGDGDLGRDPSGYSGDANFIQFDSLPFHKKRSAN
jgi:hypothetical protein